MLCGVMSAKSITNMIVVINLRRITPHRAAVLFSMRQAIKRAREIALEES